MPAPSTGTRPPTFARGLTAALLGRYGTKGLEALTLMLALRRLGADEVGVVFLTDAAAASLLSLVDVGLYTVVARRAARDELTRRCLARLTLLRAVGTSALTAAFLGLATWLSPERALLMAGFFLTAGLYEVHEIARASLAGRERFATLSALGLTAKATECAIALLGVWLGFGLVGWLAGRAVGQLGLAAVSYRVARADLPPDSSSCPPLAALLREGLPFWFVSALNTAGARLDSVLVAGWAGLAATTQLGLANRIVSAAVGLVAACSTVAFPGLARDRRALVTRVQVLWVLAIAVGLGAIVFVSAPLLLQVITGEPDEGSVEVVRAMVPVLATYAISWPLSTWLQAKQRERQLALITLVQFGVGLGMLFLFAREGGAEGAAIARLGRAVCELGLLAAATFFALRGASAQPPGQARA